MSISSENNRQEIEDSSISTELVNVNKFIPESVFEILPEPLKDITQKFTGRERDIVLLSSLGAISSCLPDVWGIYDHKKTCPNLYLFIIAPPASGKGTMNWAKKLIDPIHENIVNESRRRISEARRTNEDVNPTPRLKIKIMPGNTSSAKVYSHLQDSEDSLIIFESEADSLSNMLKQDWGNFSDLLRKSFHHESVSISRATEDKFYDIKYPKLSIVVSGTPNQVRPLIESKENGLFSRFIYYYFDEVSLWKDVSPNSNRVNYDDFFNTKSQEIKNLYDQLASLGGVEVRLTELQWDNFQQKIKLAESLILKTNKLEFIPVSRRLGIIFFRVVMILTILRNKNTINESNKVVFASDPDLQIGIELLKVFIEHSLNVYDKNEKNSIQLTMKERELLTRLPSSFRRASGLIIASNSGWAERTFDDTLKNWLKKKVIKKVDHGSYEKCEIS